MNLIVAVDSNWGIGKNNDLLIFIADDMKYFKEKTLNKVVIMGKNTFYSLPNQKPLKNRINIVLTKDKNFKADNVITCNSIEHLFEILKQYNTEDCFVIGGELIYKQLLPYCKNAYITKINHKFEADKFFHNLDEYYNWELIDESEEYKSGNVKYKFTVYKNKNIK